MGWWVLHCLLSERSVDNSDDLLMANVQVSSVCFAPSFSPSLVSSGTGGHHGCTW